LLLIERWESILTCFYTFLSVEILLLKKMAHSHSKPNYMSNDIQPAVAPSDKVSKKKKNLQKNSQIFFKWNLKGYFRCSTTLVVWNETSLKWRYHIRAILQGSQATKAQKIKKSTKNEKTHFLNFLHVSNQTCIRNRVLVQLTLFYNIIKKNYIFNWYRSILLVNTVLCDEK
jgi:hypothetical protein